MGLRFRRSINLGLGFRVNFSKSGVGYSWGVKGYRYTKTATGRTRTTSSIPGTGISWVKESGGKRNPSGTKPHHEPSSHSDSTHLYAIESADATELVPAQLQDFIGAIRRYRLISRLLLWGLMLTLIAFIITANLEQDALTMLFFILFPLLAITKIVYRFAGKIEVEYEYDEQRINLIKQLMVILKSNVVLWQVNDVFRNAQKRTSAGASESVSKLKIKVRAKKPPFLKTNVPCFYVNLTRCAR